MVQENSHGVGVTSEEIDQFVQMKTDESHIKQLHDQVHAAVLDEFDRRARQTPPFRVEK